MNKLARRTVKVCVAVGDKASYTGGASARIPTEATG